MSLPLSMEYTDSQTTGQGFLPRSFVFMPGDITLFEHSEEALLREVKEWLLAYPGPPPHPEAKWGHVSIFWGVGYPEGNELVQSLSLEDAEKWNLTPLHVEAIGRGTLKTNLLLQRGRYIKVLRHEDPEKAHAAALRAGGFARDGQRWYDYWCIIRYVMPYLIVRRTLHVNYGFGYQHNEEFICSEQADAAYIYELFDDNRRFPTLPGDYEYSESLAPAGEGVL